MFSYFLLHASYICQGNVKVITSEECVPKHKLLVMDVRFRAARGRCGRFGPRVRVWRLGEEGTCGEFGCMVGDKVEEVKWKGLCVNDHWQLATQ